MAEYKNLTEEDIQVIRAMAQCDMDSTKAAAMLHYHVGSVQYHIKRIREKTGLNPRGFFDLCKLLEMVKKMKIKVTMHVDIPISPYCGKCTRKETDKNGAMFCTLYNRFIYMCRGNWLKCLDCYMALYDVLSRED